MADWQSYLDFVREDDPPLSPLHRLLTTTTTTDTPTEKTPETDTATPPPDTGEPMLSVELAAQRQTNEHDEHNGQRLPTWADAPSNARTPYEQGVSPPSIARMAVNTWAWEARYVSGMEYAKKGQGADESWHAGARATNGSESADARCPQAPAAEGAGVAAAPPVSMPGFTAVLGT